MAAVGLVSAGFITQSAAADDGPTVPYTVMFNNFETAVAGNAPAWSALDGGGGAGTVTSFSTDDVRTRVSHARSLKVSSRDVDADGARMTLPATLAAGQSYTVDAWVYVGDGAAAVDPGRPITVEVRADGTTLPAVSGTDLTLTPGTWKRIAVAYPHTTATTLSVSVANTVADFFMDDVLIAGTRSGTAITADSTLKDTLAYPVGVALEKRSTVAGSDAESVLTAQFDQVTPENAMKPESWYGADKKFAGSAGAEMAENEGADALMDWAAANHGRVYGHVLVWHGQTPGWFYQDDAGDPLDADGLKARMREHIFAVAEYLSSRYGEFGSPTNPLAGFDVVNEVVADSASAASNGLRTSTWYNMLGEEFIDLAFQYADEAFNQQYAAAGSDRPVKLFINEYGTESGDAAGTKLQRYYDLTQRLQSRNVPIDGVGHQFHVNLNTNVDHLRAGLAKFAGTGMIQAVTEFDVTTGYPQTSRLAIRQGKYYERAFSIFNTFAAQNPGKLFSVTVWGLSDAGSWLYYNGAPLMFDDFLNPKWSLVGALGGSVPDEPKSMAVFGGDQALTPRATTSSSWGLLQPVGIGSDARFSLRWAPDHLTAWVDVTDATPEATDAVTFTVGSRTFTFSRSATGTRTVDGVATERAGGWTAVVHVPLESAAPNTVVAFDVDVTDGGSSTGWNSPGVLGELTLREALSSVDAAQVETAPTIDGTVDDVWSRATTVRTDKVTQGTDAAAYADVRTVWSGDGSSVFVLAEVTDAGVSLAPNNAWEKDSVEIFVDGGNAKNGSYRPQDVQIRINADNVVSSGQARVLQSATSRTDTGYLVEAEISLLTDGGPGTVHGMDFQVNDATGATRTGVRSWADPTGQGYQNTSRWGVVRLAEQRVPNLVLDAAQVRAGGEVGVTLSGFATGEVQLWLVPSGADVQRAAAPAVLQSVVTDEDGWAQARLTIPAGTAAGEYRLAAGADGAAVATVSLVVAAAPVVDPTPNPSTSPPAPGTGGTGTGAGTTAGTTGGSGNLATTGVGIAALMTTALALVGAGTWLYRRREAAA